MPKRKLTGQVVSNKMQRTVVVSVDTLTKHDFYDKMVKTTKRFMARDDMSTKIGDEVVIEETRPISKHVKWQVVEILEK